jgi:hypothetical protein
MDGLNAVNMLDVTFNEDSKRVSVVVANVICRGFNNNP